MRTIHLDEHANQIRNAPIKVLHCEMPVIENEHPLGREYRKLISDIITLKV